jgi:hypothetical protein
MRALSAVLAIAATAGTLPAVARDREEPIAARGPDAQDIAMTPLTDLNLKKDDIPAVLLAAATDPYESKDLNNCRALEAAITELDGALGPDMDVVIDEGDRLSTGRVAKSVVASFIPFRGILREISGAADQERDWRAAIYAGAVRRGFLKGLGQQRGCAYPARPAFARVAMPGTKAKDAKPAAAGDTPTFVSEPVVQSVPKPTR